MASKTYDYETFSFTLPNGEDVSITAWTYEHSTGWGHKARINRVGDVWHEFEKRITYYNRTYESFKYESMIRKIINAFFDGKRNELNRQYLLKQVKAIADRESEKCREWLAAFEKAYDGLSERQKESLASSNIEITNEKQADVALATIQAMALLNC